MNKDALIASVIGFFVGLFITAVIVFGPRFAGSIGSFPLPSFSLSGLSAIFSASKPPLPGAEPSESVRGESDAQSETTLIIRPQNNAIIPEDTVTIGGNAPGADLVVAQGRTSEAVIVPGEDGAYEVSLPLDEGENALTVTSYTAGKPLSERITVFYTKESL